MQVSCANDVKIYNLSCGKSLPEWLSERKRRQLLKKSGGVRNRIQLIQDFEMPDLSTGIKISQDGKYVVATGTYKPRVRCFDVNNLSMKFDRCFDAEAVQFLILSEDYSKMVFLQEGRYVEYHVRYGKHYRWRIPRSGRDIGYQYSSCNLYFAGSGSDVFLFSLELGRFLPSFVTDASSVNKVCVNQQLQAVYFGTSEGRVEMWDGRDKKRVGILDCALNAVTEDTIVNGFPSITGLACKGNTGLAVGTATGQVLLYDIRSRIPYKVKDHMNELPITNIAYMDNEDLMASMDSKCVKFWKKSSGKPFTHIQAPTKLNDMCIVPNTGLVFLANESQKMLTYYIPSIGPAPKWCYFLDSITEELEETESNTVYDNYKFVTSIELEELGLSHLVGSNLLRGYMHGYFVDVRLYNKARAIVQPFAFKEFKKKKVQGELESERKNRVAKRPQPVVNQELALHEQGNCKVTSILDDPRFKDMFEKPEFAIDEKDDEFNKVKPLLAKQQSRKSGAMANFQLVEEEESKHSSSSSSSLSEDDEDDEEEEEESKARPPPEKKTKLYDLKGSQEFRGLRTKEDDDDKSLTIGERLAKMNQKVSEQGSASGNKTVHFAIQKSRSRQKQEEEAKAHAKERAMYRRPAKHMRR